MDYRAYHHGVISIWDVLWMIILAPVHRYFGHRTYWRIFGTVALRERIAALCAFAVGGLRNV
jgi:hypothetical protein